MIYSDKISETINLGVDVIVRFHRADRIAELDLALNSLYNQDFAPVHVIVAAQGFDSAGLTTVKTLIDSFDWSARHLMPDVVNVDNKGGEDLRSKLLNEAIKKVKLRYLAFLDFDDYLYGHAYSHLVETLRESDAAVAFGGINVKFLQVLPHYAYNAGRVDNCFPGTGLRDLVRNNFCPIHSFIVDRDRTQDDLLYFDEKLHRLEDYDFLLRLSLNYKLCFSGINRKIGVYNFHIDGSNSVQVTGGGTSESWSNTKAWNDAARHIWRRQCEVRDAHGL